MNARVERLVEDYNQARAARRQLGKRLWTIYTGGAPSTLGQLLGADSIHDALVTARYQSRRSGPTARPSTGSSGCAARSRPAWPPSAATTTA